MKRVLVIDALNMFLRAFIVDPSLSTNGQPIGGIKGSIKILQKLVRLTTPDEIKERRLTHLTKKEENL
jgi:hypothetical protein